MSKKNPCRSPEGATVDRHVHEIRPHPYLPSRYLSPTGIRCLPRNSYHHDTIRSPKSRNLEPFMTNSLQITAFYRKKTFTFELFVPLIQKTLLPVLVAAASDPHGYRGSEAAATPKIPDSKCEIELQLVRLHRPCIHRLHRVDSTLVSLPLTGYPCHNCSKSKMFVLCGDYETRTVI